MTHLWRISTCKVSFWRWRFQATDIARSFRPNTLKYLLGSCTPSTGMRFLLERCGGGNCDGALAPFLRASLSPSLRTCSLPFATTMPRR